VPGLWFGERAPEVVLLFGGDGLQGEYRRRCAVTTKLWVQLKALNRRRSSANIVNLVPHPTGAPDAVPAAQGDLFGPCPERLPSDGELLELFNRLNRRHFAGTLAPARITWSTRMRIAGGCRPDTREIRLSVLYHTHYPEELENTLVHEMLHLVHLTHSTAFRQAAEKLGVSIHCREYPGIHPRSRYVYLCPNCRTVFHRRRRGNISCGKCSGRAYDPRFRLVLMNTPPRRRKTP